VNIKPSEPEFTNDVSKAIYENIVSGNLEKVAEVLYEQSVLEKAIKGEMDTEDIIKLKMSYENPDFTEEEVEEEFLSKYGLEEPDELASDEEIARYKKEKSRIEREMKRELKSAQSVLTQRKGEIKLPDVQTKAAEVDIDSLLSERMSKLESESLEAAKAERDKYVSAIDPAAKSLSGFEVSFKDEDVSFDGKFTISDEEKAILRNKAESFSLEDYYGNRYYKDGSYDVKALMEDIYFLENKDKIIQSFVKQAVNNAKLGVIKSIKNVDLEQPRQVQKSTETDKFTQAASFFFSH
jgi:hypothetical protein